MTWLFNESRVKGRGDDIAAVSTISVNEQIIPAIRQVIAAVRIPGAPGQP
jgi:hypothetical protein